MLIVSLTGGIATGKSIVADIFKNLGCFIHHADSVAHQLIEPNQPAWKQIVEHFGFSILKDDKTIDRTKLGTIIFSDTKERMHLNAFLHPLVLQQRNEVIEKLRKEGRTKIFVSEAALTIEAGYFSLFDRIVLTHCPEVIQIERLKSRDRMSQSEALKRIKSQLPVEEKLKLADYVIDTSRHLPQTVEESEKVFRGLMADYELLFGR